MGPIFIFKAACYVIFALIFGYLSLCWIPTANHTARVSRVHSFASAAECNFVIQEAEKYGADNGWTHLRHTHFATYDLPVSQISSLTQWAHEITANRIWKLFEEKYGVATADLSLHDLFVIKYSMEGQKSLELHTDGSQLTFILQLNSPTDFGAGGTYFELSNLTVRLEQGDILLHPSKLRHGSLPITAGVRYVAVGFVDVPYAHYDYWWRMFGWCAQCLSLSSSAPSASPSSSPSLSRSVPRPPQVYCEPLHTQVSTDLQQTTTTNKKINN